jgi:putative membrane protein
MYTHPAMIRTDRTFLEAIERAVGEAERGTAAELIVVVAARSGSYLDAAGALGAAFAMVVLLVALFAPTLFPPIAVAIDVPLVFALATWLAHRTPALMRGIVPAARQRKHVERAAAEHFLAEAVHGTRGRTGLLVYVSLLEERVALVPDLGLDGRVPAAAWAEVTWSETGDRSRPRALADLVRGVEQLGAILRLRLPADATDVNESPNAPRIVP